MIFWMMAGLFMAGALLFVALPLLRKEDRKPGAIWVTVLIALSLPAGAIVIYLAVGNPESLDPAKAAAPTVSADAGESHELTPDQIQDMTQRLAQRLQNQPDDADGWSVLAHSYGVLKRYGDASEAYAKAVNLRPDNAQWLADYADTLAMANGRSLQGEPEKLIQRALQVEPNNIKALALAGTVSYERKDFKGAIVHWQKIIELVPPDSQIAGMINANLSEVRKYAEAETGGARPDSGQAAGKPLASNARVSGRVEVAPELKSRIRDTDTVFIFARSAEGKGGPPLAILRKTAKELPISFTLDDTMSMDPAFKLSSASRVVIGARVSRSGNAMPGQGDIEGYSQLLETGASGIIVTINSQVK